MAGKFALYTNEEESVQNFIPFFFYIFIYSTKNVMTIKVMYLLNFGFSSENVPCVAPGKGLRGLRYIGVQTRRWDTHDYYYALSLVLRLYYAFSRLIYEGRNK